MDEQKLKQARQWVRTELEACLDFWLKNGQDRENGGVYTCLDREGSCYSTDKSVWMQGRCGWLFAWLCNMYGKRPEWLAFSKSCLDFLEAHCINRQAGGRLYFTVTGEGKPLRQRRYFYSEAFYAMANGEYYGATGEAVYLQRAKWAYDTYWDLWHGAKDPTGLGPKTEPDTRSGRSFGLPMIYLNMCSVLSRVDPGGRQVYESRAEACVEDIFANHVHPSLGCVLENVGPDGEARLQISEGRVVNPGHDIEGVWFLLEYAKRRGKPELIESCETIFNWAVERGWDTRYGGLLYFVDALGRPPEAYEHDMKLWWPHNELLIASLMLYEATEKPVYLDWFYKGMDYCREVFCDPAYGEWYGYLRRDGKPTEPACKGSTYKGPFHLPRMLVTVDMLIGQLLEKKADPVR